VKVASPDGSDLEQVWAAVLYERLRQYRI